MDEVILSKTKIKWQFVVIVVEGIIFLEKRQEEKEKDIKSRTVHRTIYVNYIKVVLK